MQQDDSMRQVKVWDLPVRLFHWGLVVLVATAWISAESGWNEVHEWTGYSILTLVLFRVLWGLVGSDNARFSRFLHKPKVVFDYLLALLQRKAPHHDTHNPAGAWGVVLMLLLLTVQAGTGLFANDDVLFEGPFYALVGSELSGWLSQIHEINFNLLLGLVIVHVTAVVLHELSGERLLQAMWHGRKPSAQAQAAQRPVWLALLVALLAVAGVWGLLALAPPPVVGF